MNRWILHTRRLVLCVAAALGAAATGWAIEPAPSPSAPGITLQECYQRAKTISETLGISNETIRLVEDQYKQAIGSILPHVYWIKSQEFQDTSANGSSGSSTVAASLTRSPIPLSYFQLQQPLFSGGRDWQALGIAKSSERQAQFNRDQTDEQLLADVATAFYTASSWNHQLGVLMDIRKLTEDRVKELQHFVDIGRSRPAEVLSAQTDMASLDAQIENAKQLYADARHLLLFLTGVPAETPLNDGSSMAFPATVDDALTRAGKRPDLMATGETLNQAHLQVRYAKGGYLPTLGFTGDYYTERVGFLSDVRWDATFLLNVPLFEGGSTHAQVQQARSQEIMAQLTLARMKRDIERQVRTAYDDVVLSQSQAQTYEKAVDLAERNYAVQTKEYRLGIINNIELLQQLTTMQTIKQQAAVAQANAKLNTILLQVTMGEGL